MTATRLAAGRSRAVRGALVLAVYVATALVQTAPLLFHVTTAVPYGNYPASTVVRLNVWTLWWNSDRLLHAYRDYWQAPIFFPDPHAFAYSEPQWLTGLIASPLWWIGSSPALPYNFIILAALVSNGWLGYCLLRRLGVASLSAVYGGLIVEAIPTVSDQLGVLQSTILSPVLATLLCLAWFGRTGKLTAALGIGLGLAACFHTNSNSALFFAPLAALGLVMLCGRWLLRPQSLLRVGLVIVIAGATIAPVAVPQRRVLDSVSQFRTESDVAGTSAHFGTYAAMPPTNVLRRRAPDRHAATLYPGTAMLVVAAVGICFGLRRRALRRWTAYGVVATALAVILSFGPLLREGPLGAVLSAPYDFLRAYYPGFRFARNLWRFGALAQVFIAVFAGLGIAACIGSGRRRSRVLLGTLATMAIIVDVLCTPIPLLDLGHPADAAWVRRLREMPSDTTVVHVPMARDATPEEMEPTARWMTSQTYHGRPIANGYSGYVPGPAAILMQVMPRFPDGDSIRVLRYFGINHVLASPEWVTAENVERMRQWDGVVVPEETIDGMMLLRIVGAAPEQTARERAVPKGPTSIP